MKQIVTIFCSISLVTLLGANLMAQEHRRIDFTEVPTANLEEDQLPVIEKPIPAQLYPEFGLYLRHFTPLNQLADAGYRNGIGMEMNVMSRPITTNRLIDLQYGLNVSFDFGGSVSFPITLGYPYRVEDASLRLANNQVGAHGVVRLITSHRFPVQLYAEGQVGSRIFYSSEGIVINGHNDEDEFCPEPETVNGDMVLSYGGAAGLRFRFAPQTYLDLRVGYLTGTGTDFIDLDNALLAEQNQVSYRLAESSRSEGWTASVGLSFPLGDDTNCAPSRQEVQRNSADAADFWWIAPAIFGGAAGAGCN
ncbi:MAG: hypothetical protein AAF804_03750 [Bacteroidota bacterium]